MLCMELEAFPEPTTETYRELKIQDYCFRACDTAYILWQYEHSGRLCHESLKMRQHTFQEMLVLTTP